MDRLSLKSVELLLGIYAPFKIKDINLNVEAEILTVQLEEVSLKSRSLFSVSAPKKPISKAISWQHNNTGRFTTYIEIEPTASTFSKNRLLNPPAFFGDKDATYTYQLQQTVLSAHSKKLDSQTISSLLNVKRETVNQIITDSDNQQQDQKLRSILPLETDPIWRALINHEISFKTNLSSLKFLISRLQLNCVNNRNDMGVIQDSVATLRQFFIKHHSQLKSEYAQIGVSSETPNTSSQPQEAKKRVTLTADHPVWENILSGQVDLLSKNMGLNLYISQLKGLYKKVENNDEQKIQIAKELLFYLKKNMSKLKPELMSISKIVKQMGEQQTADLPNIQHGIWEKILSGSINIESNQMAFKLLLVKARSNEDKQQACTQLHEYFSRNMRLLKTEISQLEQHIAIAS